MGLEAQKATGFDFIKKLLHTTWHAKLSTRSINCPSTPAEGATL